MARINVTRPFLPPLHDYNQGLKSIWESNQLTNGGRFTEELSQQLGGFFQSPHVSLYANATLALIASLRCLEISGGKVITTPFTFAATAQSIIWSGAAPVFVDIDPITLNISTECIYEAIDNDVTAVVPVHVFGNVVDTGPLADLREKYGTRVVIDAAHAFGNSPAHLRAVSTADASVVSFHATKMFNSVEGAAVLTSNPSTHDRLERFKNFAFDGDGVSTDIGLNAKMSELHALMGVAQFKYVQQIEKDRARVAERYATNLSSLNGIRLVNIENHNNNSYFPIIITDEYPLDRDAIIEIFKCEEIYVRKYFYPLLSDMPAIMQRSHICGRLQNARYVAQRILCLPMYTGLSNADIDRVSEILVKYSST